MLPRDKKDVSCVNCSRKGHMAADCRQPKAEMGKRPCFNCNEPGHLARNCREKMMAIKAVTQGAVPKAALLGCVQIVDKEGFTKVPGRARPQASHVLDFVAWAAANTQSTYRFRPLTLADLEDVAEALPPKASIGQGRQWQWPICLCRSRRISVRRHLDCRSRRCCTRFAFIHGDVT